LEGQPFRLARFAPRAECRSAAGAMTEDDPYARRWKEARRGYYVFFGTWLAFPLLGTMVDKLAQVLTPGSRVLPQVFFLIYALLWIYAAIKMRCWRCPRCERPFTHTMFWRNDFATRCVHCGLPRGATLAQAESGAFEPIRLAWRRVLRGVLAGFEMLTGVIVFYMGVFGSRQSGMGLQLAAGGLFGFLVPGALLATRSRWRWWCQLLMAVALIVLLRARVAQRAEAGALSAFPDLVRPVAAELGR
jgi:hypothetical protein